MSIRSAREKIDQGGIRSRCLPLTVDAMLPAPHELPDEFYDILSERHKIGASHNGGISLLLKDFFGVDPAPSNEMVCVAEYNAFGASVQSYAADVPYEYDLTPFEGFAEPVTHKAVRLRNLLNRAANNGLNLLFTAPSPEGNEHVAGLQLVDIEPARFLIRNAGEMLDPYNNRVYSALDLSGIAKARGRAADDYSPLPEFSRPHYPAGQTSWELTILPPLSQ